MKKILFFIACMISVLHAMSQTATPFNSFDFNFNSLEVAAADTADFDKDGKLDFVSFPVTVVNDRIASTSSLLVQRNTSASGQISFVSQSFVCATGDGIYPSQSSAGYYDLNQLIPIDIKTADLNNDGKPEIIVLNKYLGISFLKNTSTTGNISFESPVYLSIGAAAPSYSVGGENRSLEIADMNSDGRLDVLVAGYEKTIYSPYDYGFIRILYNSGLGSTIAFSSNTSTYFPMFTHPDGGASVLNSRPDKLLAVDYNNDGKKDLAAVDGGNLRIFINTQTSTNGSTSVNFSRIDQTWGSNDALATDINGDGLSEMIRKQIGYASCFALNQNGSFSLSISLPNLSEQSNVSFADLNNDGKKDGMYAEGNSLRLYKNVQNNGPTTSPTYTTAASFSNNGWGKIIACDLDNDGKKEILVGSGYFRNRIGEPIIQSFSPTSGGSGTVVNIIGKNFTAVTSVKLGGIAASFSILSDTSIRATATACGSGSITVTSAAGTGTATGFNGGFAVASHIGSISGPTIVCSPQTATYSVPSDLGATSYTWTLPSGWTGTSTSNSITVTTGVNSGNISVVASNPCGNSNPSVLAVTSQLKLLSTPTSISGPNAPCTGGTATYTTPPVTGATSYVWTIPPGWIGTSNSNSITVVPGTAGGNITVKAINSCTSSGVRSKAVIATAPSQLNLPNFSSYQYNVCEDSSFTYIIEKDSAVLSYWWSLPAGWTGNSLNDTIRTTAKMNSGFISVVAKANCSISDTLNVYVDIISKPVMPSIIYGNGIVCSGDSVTYYVEEQPNIDHYVWSIPNGWTGSSSTNSITVTPGTTSGTITVYAVSVCGINSPVRSRQISVGGGLISSISVQPQQTICANTPTAFLATSNVMGSTTDYTDNSVMYTWKIYNGGDSTVFTAANQYFGGNIMQTPTQVIQTSFWAASFSPKDKDSVVCVISSNLGCLTNNPAVSNSIVLNVHPLPTHKFGEYNIQYDCLGDSLNATDSTQDVVQVKWYKVKSSSDSLAFQYDRPTASVDPLPYFTPSTPGDYYPVITNSFGCSIRGGVERIRDSIASIRISTELDASYQDGLATGMMTTNHQINICQSGGLTMYAVDMINGGTNAAYQWYKNDVPISGADNQNLNYLSVARDTENASPSTDSLYEGDVVYCKMISGVSCVMNNTVYSDSFTIHVIKSSYGSLDTTICSVMPFEYYGQIYDASGTYTTIIPNAEGCDSIVILNLTMKSTRSLIKDTLMYYDLPLVFNDTTITSNSFYNYSNFDSWWWNFNPSDGYYPTSYFETHTLNTAGCDSLISLELTLVPPYRHYRESIICPGQSIVTVNGRVPDTTHASRVIFTNTAYSNNNSIQKKRTYMYFPELQRDTLLSAQYSIDSICYFSLRILQSDSTIIFDTSSQSFTLPWGATVTSSGVYHHTYLNIYGCDSIVKFNLTINSSSPLPVTSSFSDSGCDSYLLPWDSLVISTGTYDHTYTRPGLPDSIVTAYIVIHASQSSSFTSSACTSYTLPWNITVTSSGTYTHTYTTTAGCDSIVTAVIAITPASTDTAIVSACDTYTWSVNGQTYTSSGTYSFVSGCVTKVLNLTISTSVTTTVTASSCNSYTWSENGQTYTASGWYTYTLGCSVRILHLTITSANTVSNDAIACSSYTWSINGQTYTSSGTYSFLNGCTTQILHLIIQPAKSTSQVVQSCESYSLPWGVTVTASGTYSHTYATAAGCDSVVTVSAIIGKSNGSSQTTAICSNFIPYSWNGTEYSTSGTYTFNSTNISGCDSIAVLYLTINDVQSTSVSLSVCSAQLPYTWNGVVFTTAGTKSATLTSSTGCDSVVTMSVIVAAGIPKAPASITQTLVSNNCGARVYRYAAAFTTNASGYSWTLPAGVGGVSGVTIDSGDITSSRVICLMYASNAAALITDSIKVSAYSGCGSSILKSFKLSNTAWSPLSVPTISAVKLETNVCGARKFRYSIPVPSSTSGLVGYEWSFVGNGLGANAVIDSGTSESRVIVVLFTSNAASNSNDSIRFRYNFNGGCSYGNYVKKLLAIPALNAPAAPVITSKNLVTNICGSRKVRYSVPLAPSATATAGAATGYEWSFTGIGLGANATIDSGTVNSQVIVVRYSSNAAGLSTDSVRCRYLSECGPGLMGRLKIVLSKLNPPAAPSTLTITAVAPSICGAKLYRFSAPSILPSATTTTGAATGYVWSFTGSLGANAVIDSGSVNSQTILVKFTSNAASSVGDSVRVCYSSDCGPGPNKSLRLTNVSTLVPSAPATITITPVSTNICGARIYRYAAPKTLPGSTSTQAAATGYEWSFTGSLGANASLDSGTINSQTIRVIFTSNAAAAIGDSARVRYSSSCGNSAYKAVKLNNTTLNNCTPALARPITNDNLEATVFPNPSGTHFTLRLSDPDAEGLKIRILDLQGRWIQELPFHLKNNIEFGSDLSPGAYLLDVKQGRKHRVIKIIKF